MASFDVDGTSFGEYVQKTTSALSAAPTMVIHMKVGEENLKGDG